MSRPSCACVGAPRRRAPPYKPPDRAPRIIQGRVAAPRAAGRIVTAKKMPDVGTKCRPFLRVEKDPEAFASCNALADEIGEIDDPKKAFRIIGEAIGDEVSEVFGVMTLDHHKRFKSLSETGRGESTSVMAPIQSTTRAALYGGGDYAIIFHVHPSGIEAEPSDADIETTEAFVEAFDVIGVPLFDHIIIGGDAKRRSYYSFLAAGKL